MYIFVINLYNRPERFYNTLKNLKKCGLSEYIIRKEACTPERAKKEFPKYINQIAYNNILNLKSTCIIPTWGALACAISHYEVYQHIIRNKIKKAIIIEDDFEIIDNIKFKMFLHEGLNIFERNNDSDNLNLTFINYNGIKKDHKFVNYYRYWNSYLDDNNYQNDNDYYFMNNMSKKEILDMPFNSTQFYMINYNMAIQLTSKLLPLTYQIDLQIGYILNEIRNNCKNIWDNLSNITFYNFKNCGIKHSQKFYSDVQYYFPKVDHLKNINLFKNLNIELIEYIISYSNKEEYIEKEYMNL